MRWEVKTIEEVCQVVNGGTPRSKEPTFWGGRVQWVTPKDLGKLKGRFISGSFRQLTELGLNSSSAQLTPPNSVILSTRAPIGHLAISTIEMAVNQGCRILVPKDNLDAQFLFFYLLRSKKELNSLGTGTTFLELGAKALKGFSIPVPPMEEQERIVEILDKAFEAIDKAEANIERNLANARELFQSRLNEIFSNPPADWEVKPLGEMGSLFTDGDWIETKDQSREGIRLIQTGNIGVGIFKDRRERARWISEETFKRLKCEEVFEGDILISRLPDPIGRACLIPFIKDRCITGVDCAILRVKETITARFLTHFCNSGGYFKEVESLANGATRKRISRKNLGTIKVPNPTKATQEKIVDELDSLSKIVLEVKSKYQTELNNLEELRQSILEQAFEGKLTEPVNA